MVRKCGREMRKDAGNTQVNECEECVTICCKCRALGMLDQLRREVRLNMAWRYCWNIHSRYVVKHIMSLVHSAYVCGRRYEHGITSKTC